MATLEEMAQQTPGFGERIANLLTGGLYGGLSGRQSQWQDAERAKQMLMADTLLMRRMQAMKQEQLANALALQGEAQKERAAIREEKAQEELGQTRAFLRGRGVDIGEPDIETARMMKTQIEQGDIEKEEKRKRENAFLTVSTGAGTFQGPAQSIQELAKTNPALAAALAGQGKAKTGPKVTVTIDPVTGTPVRRVEFPEGWSQREVDDYMTGFEPPKAETPKKQPEAQPAASGLGNWWQSVFGGGEQPAEQQPESGEVKVGGFTVKRKQ